jgi:solute carrier family 50 protein (sugar transporter)
MILHGCCNLINIRSVVLVIRESKRPKTGKDRSTEISNIPNRSIAMTVLQPFVTLCGQAAPIASLALFMAPLPTIQQIKKDRRVGDLPLLPYSTMTTSAFLWTTYGILKKEPSVYVTNLFGLVLALYYFFQFVRFAPMRSPTLPGSKKQHIAGSASIVIAASLLYFSGLPTAVNVIGLSAVAICLAMFGSPLAALQTVIKTKSAKSIPLPFTLASLINCFCWTVFGIFRMKDPNIYVTNTIGLFFAVVQLVLKLKYPNGSAPAALKAM